MHINPIEQFSAYREPFGRQVLAGSTSSLPTAIGDLIGGLLKSKLPMKPQTSDMALSTHNGRWPWKNEVTNIQKTLTAGHFGSHQINTKRLCLGPLTLRDAVAVYEYSANDPDWSTFQRIT